MTDTMAEFRAAFDAFRALPYPALPRGEELRDWNSRLLDLDGYAAGYAARVRDGRIGAAEVPGTDALLLEAETLRRDLDALGPQRGGDAELVDDYRAYIGTLERMVRLLALLARPV
ncbi:hypothetical protein [Streptomyces sp. Tu 6176]|uniref:hypothetical protein n=1 Tax=Streptomyces sp. Tu 6176 TaxID=1470557 RepID=UPI00131A39DC|nr:hypothetical protein [Streptomyces sp. Tu 6176]